MKTNKLNLKKQIKVLRKTIYLKCLECCNCQVQEVTKCNITCCPLWKERPLKAKGLYTLIKLLSNRNIQFSEAKK